MILASLLFQRSQLASRAQSAATASWTAFREARPLPPELVRRPEGCLVLIRDRLPAYISWDRFQANQERLTANRNGPTTPGAPRCGPSLLAGLVRCGRCGRRMLVRYAGPQDRLSYMHARGCGLRGTLGASLSPRISIAVAGMLGLIGSESRR